MMPLKLAQLIDFNSSFPLPSIQISLHLRFQNPRAFFSFTESAKKLLCKSCAASPRLHFSSSKQSRARVSLIRADERIGRNIECKSEEDEFDDLGVEGEIFQKTLRLVECSMFASITGLAYFLSNSLAIENYLGCFFSLPIVISSIRWGLAAGRKTMVATAILLLILSGPVKASTYLLMHGLVGLAMGSFWRLRVNWNVSLALCTLVRVIGVVGYVLLTSFLIRENILNLITINVHVSLTYVLTAIGVNIIPTMDVIYILFLDSCKLGMKTSLVLPAWLEKAV